MRVNGSALKHGIDELDILHAVDHRAYESEPDDDMPSTQFVLGFDRHGRLSEHAILSLDSGNQLVIHAMKVRRKFVHLLEGSGSTWMDPSGRRP